MFQLWQTSLPEEDFRQGLTRDSVFLELVKIVGPNFLEYAEGMAKAALDQ